MEENICAMLLSIILKKSPEESFWLIENVQAYQRGEKRYIDRTITEQDMNFILKLKESGASKKYIMEIYNLSESALLHRIRRHKTNKGQHDYPIHADAV